MPLPLNLRRSIEQLVRNTFKPYQDELLVNADCEDGLPILNTAGVQNNCLAVLTTERAFSGSKSIKLSTGLPNDSIDRFLGLGIGGSLNTLKLGETYELSCWVYVPSGQSITLSNVYLRAYDYQGSFTTYDSNIPTANNRWEKLSVRFTTRASATQLFFRIYMDEYTNDGRYILVDQLRLRVGPRVSIATPTTSALADVASAGTSPLPSANDHRHGMPASITHVDLTDLPGCAVRRTSVFPIPINTWTAINFNAERYDTSPGMHSMVTNISRITIGAGQGGKYLITGCIEWATGTNGLRGIAIRQNGTNTLAGDLTEQTAANQTPVQNTSRIYELTVGDYVELFAYQTTDAGDLNINSTALYSPEFQVQWIAP